jgi:hypothetical protein
MCKGIGLRRGSGGLKNDGGISEGVTMGFLRRYSLDSYNSNKHISKQSHFLHDKQANNDTYVQCAGLAKDSLPFLSMRAIGVLLFDLS